MKHPNFITVTSCGWTKYHYYAEQNISLEEWQQMIQEILGGPVEFVLDENYHDVNAYIDDEYVGFWCIDAECAIWQELK